MIAATCRGGPIRGRIHFSVLDFSSLLGFAGRGGNQGSFARGAGGRSRGFSRLRGGFFGFRAGTGSAGLTALLRGRFRQMLHAQSPPQRT